MATATDIASVRRITNGAEGYSDLQLDELFTAGMTERQIAHRIWNEIAASSAALVDVSESGSSRSLSQAHKNALTMAAQFAPEADDTFVESTRPVRTRKAVRG